MASILDTQRLLGVGKLYVVKKGRLHLPPLTVLGMGNY